MKVLDLSRVLAGPWASQILGDLGAEVWKIERPGAGDDTRTWGPPFLQGADGVSDAAYFLCANRNKRSVAIDFAKPEGAALVRRMAGAADILVENFKTGALARHGLDYASLSAVNPGLIYCSVTGFGQTGPYAARGGYDFLIQGMSGLMSVTGKSGRGARRRADESRFAGQRFVHRPLCRDVHPCGPQSSQRDRGGAAYRLRAAG